MQLILIQNFFFLQVAFIYNVNFLKDQVTKVNWTINQAEIALQKEGKPKMPLSLENPQLSFIQNKEKKKKTFDHTMKNSAVSLESVLKTTHAKTTILC